MPQSVNVVRALVTWVIWALAIGGSWLLAVGLVLAIGVRGVLWVAGGTVSLWALRRMWRHAFRQDSEYVDEQEADVRAFVERFNKSELARRASAQRRENA